VKWKGLERVTRPDPGFNDGKGVGAMPEGDMTSLELRVRKALLRRLLRGQPADLAALIASTRLHPHEVAQALSGLSERGAVHVVDGVLIAAYPLSGVATRHRVRRNGTIIYANCAIDALAVPFMVDELVSIESDCAHCGTATTLRMNGDRVLAAHPKSLVVFHVARDCCEAGPTVLTRCPHINFFCGTDHAARWLAGNPGRSGDVLSLPQAVARARERFASTISLIRRNHGSGHGPRPLIQA
jgi:Alkylmercury lyase